MTPEQQAELRRVRVAKFDAIYGADEDHAFAEQRSVSRSGICIIGSHELCRANVAQYPCACWCHKPVAR